MNQDNSKGHEIKAIIFDYCGVISEEGRLLKGYADKFYSQTGKSRDEVWQIVLKNWHLAKVEDIPPEEFITRNASELGIPEDVFEEQFDSLDVIRPEMVNLLRILKDKYTLLLLTNHVRVALEKQLKKHGINEIVDYHLASYECRMAKPDKKIYQKALDTLGLLPEQVIFVDDMERNTKPAAEMCIKTIRFESYEKLIERFKDFGVEVE